MKYPSLLVLHEKHGEVYFNIKNEEELYKVALAVLKFRYNSGYYYQEPKKPEHPGFDSNDIDKLPNQLKADANRKYFSYTRDLRLYEQEWERYQFLQEGIKNNNGQLAWKLLREFSDGEYERVELVQYSEPEEYEECEE